MKAFKDGLYRKDWCPYIKKTFHGFGNAIEYLGRYTHRVAISNNRILSVTKTEVISLQGERNPVTQNGRSPSAAESLSAAS